MPTINLLIEKQAKIIIMSHIGRPKGKVIEGMENVDKIKKGDQNQNGKDENPDKIISFKSL